MKNEEILDTYEFHWWLALIGQILLLVVSVVSVCGWIEWHESAQPYVAAILRVLFFPPAIFAYLLPSLIDIFSMPKVLTFWENGITVIGPLNGRRDFSYEEIKELVIRKKFSLFVRGRIHFSSNTRKVLFSPEQVHDFPRVLQTIRSKGLGHIINQK